MNAEDKRVLISCVGMQDPVSEKTEEAGPILTATRHLQPDLLYMLPSMEKPEASSSTEENARETKEYAELLEEPPEGVYIRTLDVDDPRDYSQLRKEISEAILGIKEELEQDEYTIDYSYHIGLSSGTAQMQAVWLALADVGLLNQQLEAKLWRVANPRMVEDTSPSALTEEVELRFLEEDQVLARAVELLSQYNFGAAGREVAKLRELTTSVKRRDASAVLEDVFDAYNCWDMLDIPEAERRLGRILRQNESIREYQKLTELIESQTEELNRCLEATIKEGQLIESEVSLLDLFHNAKRRYEQGNYADCFARFWRLYEGGVYHQLREYGVEPTALKESPNPEALEEVKRFLSYRRTGGEGKVGGGPISMQEGKEFLKRKAPKYYGPLEKFDKAKLEFRRGKSVQETTFGDHYEDLRKVRNKSMSHHGLDAVPEEVAYNSLVCGKKLLEKAFGLSEERIETYPFSGERTRSFFGEFLESL